MRAVSRQLISYKTIDDATERIAPQADLATEVPEPTQQRPDLHVHHSRRREVGCPGRRASRSSSDDFARGLKRLCNPLQSSPMLDYFNEPIEGMDTFCEGFAAVATDAAPMKEYIEANTISGI